MNTFIIKLILMPLVVATVTLASRKWGNMVGGILASLPFVAGAILLFIAIEQGITFAVATISGVMVGILGWMIFCIVYILVGQRFNAIISTLAGYLAYLCWGAIILRFIPLLSLPSWYVITLTLGVIGLKYFPQVDTPEVEEHRKLHFEIPLRMLLITMFVVAITYFAHILGSTWSGILTPFPIITAVLLIFTHFTQGIVQVRTVIIGLFTGMFGFTTFLFLQAYFLPAIGIFYAFLWAFLIDIVITLLTRKIMLRIVI